MSLLERLRAVDRRWFVLGGGIAALVVVLIVIVVSTGGPTGQLVIGEPPITGSATPSTSAAPGAESTSGGPTIPTSTTSTLSRTPSTGEGLGGYRLEIDPDDPAVAARPEPVDVPVDEPPPTTIAPPSWAASTRITEGGLLGTEVGCADDLSNVGLDRFFAARVGPVLGWDYQHVYPLGGDRYLWLFQDAFLDHTGTVNTLGPARFVHNAALVQQGTCFQLLHQGTTNAPDAFEVGDGSADLRTRWFWPMGGELVAGQLWVFWAEMIKDPYNPDPPDGLGWHPQRTYIASYDAATMRRTSFALAANSGAVPIYGYAVGSDESHTYLFGNTFEQNLFREGGFWAGPHSATDMWLARVPLGRMSDSPEYRTGDGWSADPADAVPIVSRFWAENPMQPRYLAGQWVSATAVDGYWGDHLAIDVAAQPWGPWTTVQYSELLPRGSDPLMNTYHAQPLPWRDGFGSLLITVSNNARNMARDAYGAPSRYRPMVIFAPYQPTPPPPSTTTTIMPRPTTTTMPRPTTTVAATSTTATTTGGTSTSVPVSTSTSTTPIASSTSTSLPTSTATTGSTSPTSSTSTTLPSPTSAPPTAPTTTTTTTTTTVP